MYGMYGNSPGAECLLFTVRMTFVMEENKDMREENDASLMKSFDAKLLVLFLPCMSADEYRYRYELSSFPMSLKHFLRSSNVSLPVHSKVKTTPGRHFSLAAVI